MHTIQSIDHSLLTRPTGDPFADTGGFTIEQLWKIPKLKDKTILELIEYTAKIYVNHWGGSLNAFFLNSKITQTSGDYSKPEYKISKTIEYFKNLINGTEEYIVGFCRILGIKAQLFKGGRDNFILCGSGMFINFHHAFQDGVMLSKEALIRMFFIPLGTQQLGGKIIILSSNQEKVSKRYVRQNIIDNISRLSSGIAGGVLKSTFNHPASAIFDFVHSCLTDQFMEFDEDESVEIQLSHFTNFAAKPEIQLYNFSSPLFSFYQKVLHRDLASDWKKFIRKHYYSAKHKGTIYQPDSELFISEKKQISINHQEYKHWINWIYQDLLSEKSILPAILNWNKKHSFNFKIVRLYQNHLRNMDQKTLDKIEAIANYIISDEVSLKKRIGLLNRAEKIGDVRRFLLKLIDDNHSKKNEQPIISLDDYINYLFPDGRSAKEIRDLLLIALYQKMHENKIFFNEIETIQETEK